MLTNDGLFSKTPFGITLSGTSIRPEALCDLVNTEAARRNSPPPPESRKPTRKVAPPKKKPTTQAESRFLSQEVTS